MNKTFLFTLVSLVPACFDPTSFPDGPVDDAVEGSTTTAGESESSSTSSSSTTATSDADTTTTELESSSSVPPSQSESGSPTEGGGSAPDGSQCQSNDECESGSCYSCGVLGSICGECLSDDDCAWGCRPASPLTDPPGGSSCDDGGLAAGCETDAACQAGLACNEVVTIPGVLTVNGCSACTTDADCGGDLCSPNLGSLFPHLVGYWRCVGEGSQPLGAGCSRLGGEDPACTTGFCAAGDLMGLVEIGICSECVTHGDCTSGMCEAPEVALDGTVVPGRCV